MTDNTSQTTPKALTIGPTTTSTALSTKDTPLPGISTKPELTGRDPDTFVTLDKGGVPTEFLKRYCTDYRKQHDAHVWHSHVRECDTYCPGGPITAEVYQKNTGFGGGTYSGTGYTNSWKPKPMTDYVKTTDQNDKPWREDYDAPLTVREARAIAFDMHKDDKDKTGQPYKLHLAAVEAGVKVLAGPDAVEERIAALFHDAVEDGHTTLKHLREIGCTEDTIVMIAAVSKHSGEEQNVYLERIKKAGLGAARVKVADLLHNLRHDRIKAIKEDYTRNRLLKKYRPALAALLLHLELLADEDAQKATLVTKPVGSATGGTGSFTSGGSGALFTVKDKALLIGDWPKGWKAPIVASDHGNGESVYVLANGEDVTLPWKNADLKVYSHYSWEHKAVATLRTHAAYSDLTADDVDEFCDTVEAAKKASAKGDRMALPKAIGSADVASADPDDWSWLGV